MADIAVKTHLVEKRNILNEMRAAGWTLQELKFFDLYLSKINARDPESRKFRMPLWDFIHGMDIQRPDIRNIRPIRDSLLQKIVVIPRYNEKRQLVGESAFQLFKECEIEKDEYDEWYIEFDAHDRALPLMFEFKEKYVTYEVRHLLGLRGENHVRMYQILKQYEGLGEIMLPLEELRKRLGVKPEEYTRWDNFKAKVLDECRKALEKHTDIKYTYEPIKRGSGKTSPVKAVKFFITENTKAEQLSLFDEDVGTEVEPTPKPYELYHDPSTMAIANAFNFRFDDSQMKLIEQVLKDCPNAPKELEKRINFYKRMNAELNHRISQKKKEGDPVRKEFAFALKMIKNQLQEEDNR
jgi:hypothetical protein